MVGEIRDGETASLAINAALTGHLVLSTLHTNSAAGALPRMLEMKIEPFLIASTVNVIIAQRLVRRLCKKDKPYVLTPDEVRSFGKGVDPDRLIEILRKEKVIKPKDLLRLICLLQAYLIFQEWYKALSFFQTQ